MVVLVTFKVHPVAKLKSPELRNMLLDAISVVKSKGGYIVSIVCDNCPTNQAVYKIMGGPGKIKLADQSVPSVRL